MFSVQISSNKICAYIFHMSISVIKYCRYNNIAFFQTCQVRVDKFYCFATPPSPSIITTSYKLQIRFGDPDPTPTALLVVLRRLLLLLPPQRLPLLLLLQVAEILHQLIGSLSHYFDGFVHPRWCRISVINSTTTSSSPTTNTTIALLLKLHVLLKFVFFEVGTRIKTIF